MQKSEMKLQLVTGLAALRRVSTCCDEALNGMWDVEGVNPRAGFEAMRDRKSVV